MIADLTMPVKPFGHPIHTSELVPKGWALVLSGSRGYLMNLGDVNAMRELSPAELAAFLQGIKCVTEAAIKGNPPIVR
jgi:hypothetical protein